MHRQKQLGYSDRCHSSSKGPKGMGPSGGCEASLSLPAKARGWLAPCLRQPITSWPWPFQTTSVFNLSFSLPFFLSSFLLILSFFSHGGSSLLICSCVHVCAKVGKTFQSLGNWMSQSPLQMFLLNCMILSSLLSHDARCKKHKLKRNILKMPIL